MIICKHLCHQSANVLPHACVHPQGAASAVQITMACGAARLAPSTRAWTATATARCALATKHGRSSYAEILQRYSCANMIRLHNL